MCDLGIYILILYYILSTLIYDLMGFHDSMAPASKVPETSVYFKKYT